MMTLDEERELARLRWERQYLLNQITPKGVVGNASYETPFSTKIVDGAVAKQIEADLRNAYIDLGGDVWDWYIKTLNSWISFYGFYVTGPSTVNRSYTVYRGLARPCVIAYMTKLDNGMFVLRDADGSTHVNIRLDDTFEEVRLYLVEWAKERIESERPIGIRDRYQRIAATDAFKEAYEDRDIGETLEIKDG